MYNYNSLLEKYKKLQTKNKKKYYLITRQKKKIEELTEQNKELKRQIKRRNKKLREKNIIIGCLLEKEN